jgi:Rrf2 family protein
MNIGRRVDYALRALAYLAAQPAGQIVSRREIQNQQDIPAHFLSKIMKRLVSAGVVCSHVGAKGGFTLGRPAAEVSVKEVYECLEGPLLLMECLARGEMACRYCTVCSQISVWREAQRMLAAYLAQISLGELSDAMGLRARLAERLAERRAERRAEELALKRHPEYRELNHRGE